MRGVAITASKGGVGKTSLAHALALGAAWHHVPAYFMHTDNRKPISVNGRPYGYYDARDPKQLTSLIGAIMNDDGLCVIDSGGNRPEFDQWIATSVDLVIIPVTPDPEAVEEGLDQMKRLTDAGAEHIRFFVNMYPSGSTEREYVSREFLSRLPLDQVMGRIGEVRAIRTLRQADNEPFQTPPSRLNNLSRSFYRQVRETLDDLEQGAEDPETANASA